MVAEHGKGSGAGQAEFGKSKKNKEKIRDW
jgi:hypothetical protein